MHLHANVSSKSPEENSESALDLTTERSKPTCNRKLKNAWLRWADGICIRIKDFLDSFDDTQIWTVSVTHIERVKSYAPKIDHLVADIYCTPSTVDQ